MKLATKEIVKKAEAGWKQATEKAAQRDKAEKVTNKKVHQTVSTKLKPAESINPEAAVAPKIKEKVKMKLVSKAKKTAEKKVESRVKLASKFGPKDVDPKWRFPQDSKFNMRVKQIQNGMKQLHKWHTGSEKWR